MEPLGYPAVTFPAKWVSDHHPLMLGLDGTEERAPSTARTWIKYKVNGLSKEVWEERDEAIKNFFV